MARCGCQAFQLVKCQIGFFHILRLDFVEKVVNILADKFVAVGDFQQPSERRVITGSRVVPHLAVCQPQLVRTEQIFSESFAEFNREVAEGAMSIHIVVEMAVYRVPLLVFFATHLLEVGEEVPAHLVVVEKVEFLVDKRSDAQTADCFGLFEPLTVEIAFDVVAGLA